MPRLSISAVPGRLVAHVRAVGQVVGAELPGEELVEKCGLVAGPARRVERRAVGRVERAAARRRSGRTPRPTRSARSGRSPRAAASARSSRPCALSQWSGCAASASIDHSREELRADLVADALVGHGLGAVLAELEAMPLAVGRGPGAALAVEPVLLVDREEDPHGFAYAQLGKGDPERARDGGKARRVAATDAAIVGGLGLDRRLRQQRGRLGGGGGRRSSGRWPSASPARCRTSGPGRVSWEESVGQEGEGIDAGVAPGPEWVSSDTPEWVSFGAVQPAWTGDDAFRSLDL